MGCKTFCTVFVVVFGVSVAVVSMLIGSYLFPIPETPRLDEHQWWGKGQETDHEEDTSVNRMYVNLSDETLTDLKERLSKTLFFENLEGIDWEYGVNPEYMKDVVEYWKTKFDWRKQESILNTYPHYKTKISGLDIHFVHHKAELKEGQKELAIMMVHGWPGSFYEFYPVIPKLISASTDKYAFSIICPSIPGYGLSEAPHKPGFDTFAAARVFAKLMDRLGYPSYYLQGGDWGSAITSAWAIMNPSQIRGLHLNMFSTSIMYSPFEYIQAKLFFPEKEQKKIFPVKDFFFKVLAESGYFHLQATRPHSVGLALNDSPAGLAAYILEKFAMWSGCQTTDTAMCLESCFSKDDLLTNVMIYWATHSITSSIRLYYEAMHSPNLQRVGRIPITVPTGLADFPHELFAIPAPFAHKRFVDIVQFSEMPRGGHFAAFEEPQLFANDVIKFIEKVEKRISLQKADTIIKS
ncbi:epoxide hydrolase 1-like [Acropora muricata]|uniref:epoxide hydrolase 1-like n=1 Tax=Acropora muricata TaxID=159855 RepID=UPI0034E448DE